MTTSITIIARVDQANYRLGIHIEGRELSFELSVKQHEGIDVVTWDDGFAELMRQNFRKADALLPLVLAFHQAQSCDLRYESQSG